MRPRAVWAATTLVLLALLALLTLLAVAYLELRRQRAELDALAPRVASLDRHCSIQMIKLESIQHEVFYAPWMRDVVTLEYVDEMHREWNDVNVCLPEPLWIRNRNTQCNDHDLACIAAVAAKVHMILAVTRK